MKRRDYYRVTELQSCQESVYPLASKYMQLQTASVPEQALPPQNLMWPAAERNGSRRFAYAPNSSCMKRALSGPRPGANQGGLDRRSSLFCTAGAGIVCTSDCRRR
ncbi:hypothetical protein TRIATDRAFT_301425 [Trichoderma atroviride IMI 206040]|uniref:Uncharacterized protein n=1 Tax=Hypocrea atroviridis (strain ATCC 20476 / IMI 206040) TaxID=452589 RepID=G9P650_HYPAI|nr:uncharacterized protein TRIATDRAFT_301425 [Trichoderma atroviride IMI 206040]EHK40601.1 hypothetical protein TRIATDRAFT_301425 [Trichoderma atroviride IMI 206040]